jgi:hypothetical protein
MGDHVRNPELASPDMLGNRPIPLVARVAALDCLLDDIGTGLTPGEADMVVDYAAVRFERGEIEGALRTLTMACDLTGAYRLAAVMHTEKEA